MNKTCKVYKQNSSIFLDSHLYIKSILYLRLQSVTAKISVSDKHSCIKNINYNSLRRNADNIYFHSPKDIQCNFLIYFSTTNVIIEM